MFAGLCASLAGVASQAGDADSSRAPGLTSGSWTEPGVLACTLQFTVILKNPAKCLWRWEPDRRNNFFGPPAHLWVGPSPIGSDVIDTKWTYKTSIV